MESQFLFSPETGTRCISSEPNKRMVNCNCKMIKCNDSPVEKNTYNLFQDAIMKAIIIVY